MTFHPDLTPLQGPKLLAIGWLECGYEHTTGTEPEPFSRALGALLKDPWNPAISAGVHFCDLCPPDPEGKFQAGGYLNLYVPGQGVVFYSPELIGHYIHVHQYLPPAVFQDAVMASPPMRSPEYFDALKRNGPPDLVKT